MFLRQFSRVREHQLIQTAIVLPILTLVIQNLDRLLSVTPIIDEQFDRLTLTTQNQETTFDYIIVGAGSAGSILASRLSENGSIRVLLLEAGGVPSPILALPTLAFSATNIKAHDWAHRTVPQRNAALALNNRVSFWPAGKVLGGSSALNGLIYIRGNVQGYDLIANRTGDPLWKSKNILKFYKKLEDYNGWFDRELHGENGELSIETPTLVPLTNYFLRAGQEMGYPIRDPNAKEIQDEGFAPIDSYMRNGARADAYRSTLRNKFQRKNLVVRKFSFVTKLLFHSGAENDVSGVEYERHGKTFIATAAKETILSAGALSTPKILMLSGIGPQEHLLDMNIPFRLNLPVGQRLQDKYGALIGPFIVPRGYSFNQDRDINITSIWQWLTTGKGLLSSARTEGTFAILSDSAKMRGDSFAPDIHTYLLSQTPVKPESSFGANFNFNEASLDYMRKSLEYGDGFFQLVTLNRAVGTGFLQLQDANPRSPLVIDPKYLEHPQDVRTLVEGIRFSVDLVEKTKAIQQIGAQLFHLPFPGCEEHTFKSDSYFECLGRHATITAFKFCGTATIGTREDPEAVVDSRFRVFGTKRLRVIDGSLLRINEANTNDVTARMIGELGSHVILNTD